MSNYDIEYSTRATRDLRKAPRHELPRIVARIEALGEDPRGGNATKMVGQDGWRVRQGDYRIIYFIDDADQVVTIARVGHRREIYD